MKKKSILVLLGAIAVAVAGTFAFTACDQKTTAPSVENSDVRAINIADTLRDDGLRVDRVLLGSKTVATVYVRYEKPFSATVILVAFDRTGNEIGRSKRVLSGNVDEAGYSDFDFDARVPMKSASYFRLIRAAAEIAVGTDQNSTATDTATAMPPKEVADDVPADLDVPPADQKPENGSAE